MKLLCLETSGPVAGVAMVSDGKLVYEAYQDNGLTHSLTLMNMVDTAFDCIGWACKDLDVVAATVGPGSFTGVRIGVSTARALAHASGAKTVGVNALDALAYNACFYGDVCAMMDARRQQVYAALYQRNQRLTEYMALPVEELLQSIGSPTLFIGDGAYAFRETIINIMSEKAFFAPAHLNYQRASSAAMFSYEKAMRGETGGYGDLNPFYLRPSQAEREYESRHKNG